MRLSKPSFWDTENSLLAIILFPFSLIFNFLVYLKKKLTKEINFKIPIICVGNIYLGGTGKTPSSIFIARELVKKNKNPVIIRKYYKDHRDEHDLIRKNYDNLILSKNRVQGINEAIIKGFDTIVLDDGFQDYKINKNLNIICFNQNQKIGNGFTLPAGPLRERLTALKNSKIVLINGEKDLNFEKKILEINKTTKIYYSKFKPININQFRNSNLLAFAGIGNPINFFNILKNNNLNIFKEIIFPDHYEFTKSVLLKLISFANLNNLKIVTTEKDFLRIKHLNLDNIEYLKVELEIENKENLLEEILEVYD